MYGEIYLWRIISFLRMVVNLVLFSLSWIFFIVMIILEVVCLLFEVGFNGDLVDVFFLDREDWWESGLKWDKFCLKCGVFGWVWCILYIVL